MSILLLSNIVLFGIGCLIMLIKPKYVVIYYLLWAISAAYFFDAFLEKLPQENFSTFDKYANIYIYVAASYFILRKGKKLKLNNKKLLLVFIVFLILIYYLSVKRGCLMEFFPLMFQYYAWIPLAFIVWLLSFYMKVYEKFATIVIWCQSLLILIQYMGLGVATFQLNFGPEFYSPCGTYYRYNFLASSFAPILLFLLMSKMNGRNFKTMDYGTLFLGGLCILLSGARTELIIFIFSLIVIFYFKFSDHKIAIISVSIIAVIILSGYIGGFEAGAEHGVDIKDRNSNIFAILNGDMDYLTEHSTFGITFSAFLLFIEEPSNWLLGMDTFFKSDGYGFLDDATKTDATLMFYISILGIVGLLFLLYFLFSIAKQSNNLRKWKFLFIFFFLFCTVTDLGIFHVMDTAFFLLFCRYADSICDNEKNEYNNPRRLCATKAMV